mmetsp:Transcript_93118/g.216403  ORF Transcript_93118/g.216403 Transcript_93118/m.216403 type:complete len:222 (+) Transcript_93118:169-834(+)
MPSSPVARSKATGTSWSLWMSATSPAATGMMRTSLRGFITPAGTTAWARWSWRSQCPQATSSIAPPPMSCWPTIKTGWTRSSASRAWCTFPCPRFAVATRLCHCSTPSRRSRSRCSASLWTRALCAFSRPSRAHRPSRSPWAQLWCRPTTSAAFLSPRPPQSSSSLALAARALMWCSGSSRAKCHPSACIGSLRVTTGSCAARPSLVTCGRRQTTTTCGRA